MCRERTCRSGVDAIPEEIQMNAKFSIVAAGTLALAAFAAGPSDIPLEPVERSADVLDPAARARAYSDAWE